LGIDEEEADKEDFHFICDSCRRRESTAADQQHPRTIKIKATRQEKPTSPHSDQTVVSSATSQQQRGQLVVELQSRPSAGPADGFEPLPPAIGKGSVNDGVSGMESARQSSPIQGNLFSSPHPNLPPVGRQPLRPGPHDLSASNAIGDGNGTMGVDSKSTASTDALSPLAGSGSGVPSPSKQPHRPPSPPTKTSTFAPAPAAGLVPSLPAQNMNGMTSSPATSLPHLTPSQPGDARSDPAACGTSPLPPSSAGLSPTKHSPPVPRFQQLQISGGANGIAASAVGGAQPSAAVFPPTAALSPSPRQPILTPPVKPLDPVRVPPPQSPQGMQTPKLVPSSSPRLGPQSG
jgi:hypothetical protein